MSELPNGWVSARLSELLTSYSAGVWGSDPATPGQVAEVLRMGTSPKTAEFSAQRRAHCPPGSTRNHDLLPGDVVMTTSGDIGKVALITREPHETLLCASNFVRVLRTDDLVLKPHILALFPAPLRSPATSSQDDSGGTTIKNLRTSFFSETEIPLAPRPEQTRIVAAIEEQFSRLDAGVAALERVRQNLKRMRAAALTGLLRAEDGHRLPGGGTRRGSCSWTLWYID